jgi:hypothetical protein
MLTSETDKKHLKTATATAAVSPSPEDSKKMLASTPFSDLQSGQEHALNI